MTWSGGTAYANCTGCSRRKRPAAGLSVFAPSHRVQMRNIRTRPFDDPLAFANMLVHGLAFQFGCFDQLARGRDQLAGFLVGHFIGDRRCVLQSLLLRPWHRLPVGSVRWRKPRYPVPYAWGANANNLDARARNSTTSPIEATRRAGCSERVVYAVTGPNGRMRRPKIRIDRDRALVRLFAPTSRWCA
jgi:hypothetical protein